MTKTDHIAIITDSEHLKRLLQEALSKLSLNCTFYKDVHSNKDSSSIRVGFNEDDSENSNSNYDKIFSLPIKIGGVIDELYYLIHQKSTQDKTKPLKMGKFTLDLNYNLLISSEGSEKIALTDKEKDILFFLYTRKGNKTSRETLLNEVWNYAAGIETHTLETHIYRLRQKIEPDPANPEFLMTDDEGYYLKL